MEPYRSYFPHAGLLLPETEKILDRALSFPTGLSITERHINKICHTLAVMITYGRELQEKITASSDYS